MTIGVFSAIKGGACVDFAGSRGCGRLACGAIGIRSNEAPGVRIIGKQSWADEVILRKGKMRTILANEIHGANTPPECQHTAGCFVE